jgi:hypothetical protein
MGRMVSAYKTTPKGCVCVWNANVVSPSKGKIWYGDLNLTRDGDKLRGVAKSLGETLYVLREMACRFESENDPIEILIANSVWSTDKETPSYEN